MTMSILFLFNFDWQDWTFVCPTEIIAFSDRHSEFEALGAQVSRPRLGNLGRVSIRPDLREHSYFQLLFPAGMALTLPCRLECARYDSRVCPSFALFFVCIVCISRDVLEQREGGREREGGGEITR